MKKHIFILLTAFLLQNYITKAQSSVIESVDYDKAKDVTNYIVLPYGSVALPGRWTKESYSDISYQ
ncbi:MAG: hypothetical protein H0W73_03455 [Bacteroidetes bacterium]|nr:hypothetical protein [Bacteroidota bacterium]